VEKAVDNRLAELERRIAALESAALSTAPQAERGEADVEWALEALREREGWAALAGGLAALGNPVRLTLLREIVRGRATVSALSEVDGLGTSGQIYHHLRQLTAEGWLHSPSRGAFAVPPSRVVALLAILDALQN
jgi:DNA-binding transcriptional ArsR family regulator